jgi:uncharacterized membrane protein YdbT with pleckstrin-like domain
MLPEGNMSYVTDNLLNGERVNYEARLHWGLFLHWKSLVTLTIWAWTRRASSEFVVTNRRVIIKQGLVQRRTLELNLQKVESIGVSQGFWGRVFGFGSLEVIGTGGTKEIFHAIADPLAFRHAVQEATAALGEVRQAGALGDGQADQPTLGNAQPQPPTADDPVARLRKAREMLETGLITPEEFERVRARILETM